jgi:hypothetical protein
MCQIHAPAQGVPSPGTFPGTSTRRDICKTLLGCAWKSPRSNLNQGFDSARFLLKDLPGRVPGLPGIVPVSPVGDRRPLPGIVPARIGRPFVALGATPRPVFLPGRILWPLAGPSSALLLRMAGGQRPRAPDRASAAGLQRSAWRFLVSAGFRLRAEACLALAAGSECHAWCWHSKPVEGAPGAMTASERSDDRQIACLTGRSRPPAARAMTNSGSAALNLRRIQV